MLMRKKNRNCEDTEQLRKIIAAHHYKEVYSGTPDDTNFILLTNFHVCDTFKEREKRFFARCVVRVLIRRK